MIDIRKLHGASEAVFQKFSATELYLKRARKIVAKMMRLQWTQDLDIETLEARGHLAIMEDLLEVGKFHLPRYKNTVKIFKSSPAQVNPSDFCHEICSHVFVYQSEGVKSQDLSIFDGGHDCYS